MRYQNPEALSEKLIALRINHARQVVLTPKEFLQYSLSQNKIDEKTFAALTGYTSKYIDHTLERTEDQEKLPGKLVGKLAKMATAAPYNDPLFWRHTQFVLRRDEKGAEYVSPHIIPLADMSDYAFPALNTRQPLDHAYSSSKRGSRWNEIETMAMHWKYANQPQSLTLTPSDYAIFILLANGITARGLDERLGTTHSHYAQQALRYSTLSNSFTGIMAQLCSEPPFNDPLYWQQQSYTVKQGIPLPQLDLNHVKPLSQEIPDFHTNTEKKSAVRAALHNRGASGPRQH